MPVVRGSYYFDPKQYQSLRRWRFQCFEWWKTFARFDRQIYLAQWYKERWTILCTLDDEAGTQISERFAT